MRHLPSSTVHPGWHARLRLRFAHDAGATRLVQRRHEGPLRVQKALYPEGAVVCHAVVVHPLGGVASGDVMEGVPEMIPDIQVEATFPGGTKLVTVHHPIP